jgi:hypothetical protein
MTLEATPQALLILHRLVLMSRQSLPRRPLNLSQ